MASHMEWVEHFCEWLVLGTDPGQHSYMQKKEHNIAVDGWARGIKDNGEFISAQMNHWAAWKAPGVHNS